MPRPFDRRPARHAFRLCLTRSPRPEELARITAFYRASTRPVPLGRARRGPKVAGLGIKDPPTPLLSSTPPAGADADELAAWTTVARVLLNLDETVTKE